MKFIKDISSHGTSTDTTRSRKTSAAGGISSSSSHCSTASTSSTVSSSTTAASASAIIISSASSSLQFDDRAELGMLGVASERVVLLGDRSSHGGNIINSGNGHHHHFHNKMSNGSDGGGTGGGDDDHDDMEEIKGHSMAAAASAAASSTVSSTGLAVLVLLAVQNCSKNLIMRYVMKDQPQFLTSAAVLGSEFLKLSLSCLYILFVERKSVRTIVQFLRDDRRNTALLAVPASAYNLQMSLEYVALANLDAAVFSVLVQTKLVFTATFAAVVLRKRLKYIQVISLLLLTVGVMLCNLSSKTSNGTDEDSFSYFDPKTMKGIMATLGIALSSGFASVYTEKVIKGQNKKVVQAADGSEYSLAYTQVQLALMSLLTIGVYACMSDWQIIVQHGLFYNFTPAAFVSVAMSAIGGLIVAGVLKYADSVLKGYATAMSVILTGMLSMVLFGTQLNILYFMGIINVITAVLLYNGKDLDQYLCKSG